MQNRNLMFLTMSRIVDIECRGIYTDLLRKFRNEGWNVYVVTPHERSLGMPTELKELDGVHILGVKTLNLQKTSVIEKGTGQVLVEDQYKRAIKRHLAGMAFDLILYSTPPITFPKVIAYLKRQNPQARTYLLLKDIFPQNAVDIGMMPDSVHGEWFTVHGWVARGKLLLYRYFRKKEKKLYALSDYIGCMSPANVEYVIRHNPEVDPSKVELAPNSLELSHTETAEMPKGLTERTYIRRKYKLPEDRPIFIYGGNFGKPQGMDYLIKCLDANKRRTDCHFLAVGSGTEYAKLEAWYKFHTDSTGSIDVDLKANHSNQMNVTVMKGLPKDDYDMLARSCDVGLIFLDHRFTIPNYPSRLLSYLENKMPVLCATDVNTDMGRIAEENGFGFWCESVRPEDFTALVDKILQSDYKAMGERGYDFLKKHYLVEHTYNAIVKHLV